MKKINKILNPIGFYSEQKLFIFGIIITIFGTLSAYFNNVFFDGIFDAHKGERGSLLQFFIDNIINISLLSIALYLLGYTLYRKTRFIDILNTVLISRLPLYLSVWFFPFFNDFNERIIKNNPQNLDFSGSEILILFLISMGSLFLLSIGLIILFKGFKTASNSKTKKGTILFIIVCICLEFLSKVIFSYL